MLYKVHMEQYFAEAPDRIGVIEADSLLEAAGKLVEWNAHTMDWGGFSPGHVTLQYTPNEECVVLEYPVTDLGTGRSGHDRYVVTPGGPDTLMFYAEAWKQVFEVYT